MVIDGTTSSTSNCDCRNGGGSNKSRQPYCDRIGEYKIQETKVWISTARARLDCGTFVKLRNNPIFLFLG
jgi:hypothetical protein